MISPLWLELVVVNIAVIISNKTLYQAYISPIHIQLTIRKEHGLHYNLHGYMDYTDTANYADFNFCNFRDCLSSSLLVFNCRFKFFAKQLNMQLIIIRNRRWPDAQLLLNVTLSPRTDDSFCKTFERNAALGFDKHRNFFRRNTDAPDRRKLLFVMTWKEENVYD